MSFENCTTNKSKMAWERELDIAFNEDVWKDALNRTHTSTFCARLGLIQFKVLNRGHFCKTRLTRIYPDIEDKCDRCDNSPCNLSHMFFLSKTTEILARIF